MANTVIKTKILLRNDALSNWVNSDAVLGKGEIAIATIDDSLAEVRVGTGSSTWATARKINVFADQISGLLDTIQGNTKKYQVVANGEGGNSWKLQEAALSGGDWTDVTGSDWTVDFSGITAQINSVSTLLDGEIDYLSAQLSAAQDSLADARATLNTVSSDYLTSTDKTELQNAIDALDNGLSDYYQKSETSSAAEISTAISGLEASLTETYNEITSDYATKQELANGLGNLSVALEGDENSVSSDSTIEGAKRYAEEVAGNALSDANAYTNTSIEELDFTDEEVASQFVTKVDQVDGVISVTRAQPVVADISGLQDALDGKNKVQVAQTFGGELAQTDLSVIKVTDAGLAAYANALDAGTLNQNAVSFLDLSAPNALGQKVENVAAGTVSSDAATYGQLTAAVENITGNYATKQELNSVSTALSTDYSEKVKEVDDKLSGYYLKTETSSAVEINNALTAVNDSLTAFVEKSALSISYDSTAKKIYLSGGTNVSEIDASDFIKDGMLSTATYDADSKNIILSFNTDAGATPISVDVGDLVDTYTAAPNADTVQLAVNNNEFSASIVNGSITPEMLSSTALWIFDCNA